MRDFERPGRSLVAARNGMAATSHPLSTLAAINILQQGGNAIDAAVAACAVQCVVEPGSTGIGGDCFVLLSPDGTDKIVAYNGSGRAPAAATVEWYQQKGIGAIPRQSPHAVTIPGAVEAWARLVKDYGTCDLGALLQSAIALARDGYAITPRVARDWQNQEQLLRANTETARVFLPDGTLPAVGSVHHQVQLSQTLSKIGEHGPDAFYRGAVATDMVDYLQSLGGLHTLDDFARAEGTYEQPVSTDFRGYRIHECPPNGQGIVALLILNILSGFEADGDPLSPERLHREIEATRLAYSVRDAVLADPAQTSVPVEQLLSMEFAASLRRRIASDRKIAELPSFVPSDHRDTVYISVVDKNRMAVSFINSIFHPFGSGLTSPNSGVLFHNRGQSFVLDAGHPNRIAPGKRPMHTIIPGMATRNGWVDMAFGVMGGQYQAMGHAHFVSKIVDYGLDLQSAMDLPRLFPKPGTDEVEVEGPMPPETCEALRNKGFNLVPPSWAIGGAQAVRICWDDGTLLGASDHRKDGLALGY